MKTTNQELFKKCWIDIFDHVGCLASSLPSEEALEYLEELKELRVKYLQKACEYVYGGKKN